jgi:oligopeptide/dipeptide ABC transporter ATP-binding protein
MAKLLEIDDLRVQFQGPHGVVKAVDGISYTVDAGETIALVGESGCGKSVSALAVLGLVPSPPGHVAAGSIRFDGTDLTTLGEEQIRDIRGHAIAMVFQEPMTSLNPVLSIGVQLTESMRRHLGLSHMQATTRAVELLQMVGIAEPEQRLEQYPHHFSGGMRQRVMIAVALSCEPRLIIADEPTTALDVTIQAQILELMRDLTSRLGVALVIITHNLGVVARYADRVNVMYAGRIVESATTREIYAQPRHPYTIGLLSSLPRLDKPRGERLVPIEGQPPDLARLDDGCAYRPRCRWAIERCARSFPPLEAVGQDHHAACFRSGELAVGPRPAGDPDPDRSAGQAT